ncbi:MAG: 4-hydroxy-tetrahydrodipicolinate synthase [bacterium]|jgi:4-hydroxy-tetrahydrodipicolinate synthase
MQFSGKIIEMIHGSIVPLVTPFRNGRIDEGSLQRLVDWQIASGSHGISVTGTTGEPSSLSRDERKRVFEIVSETINKRIPFVPATGSNNLEETLELSRYAEKLSADAVLVITPYYVRPSQEGLYHYFRAIASDLALPVILYNIPGRAAINLEIETVLRLRESCPNIVGIKEANKDFEHINLLLHRAGRDFLVYSGIELLCFPILAVGGAGFISATANLLPDKMALLYNLSQQGKWDDARALHFYLTPLNEAVFYEINPVPVKTALGWMGKLDPEVRLPLTAMSPHNQERLKKVLKTYNLINND